jgi:RNA polymerase sigma-70 factor (ECF subfamily)
MYQAVHLDDSLMLSEPQERSRWEPYASRYRQVLMAFFLRRVANQAEAEDLTQDALIRLASANTPSVQHPDAYVFQVAANLLRDRQRRNRVRSEYLFALWGTEQGRVEARDPSRVAEARESLASLQSAICELPDRTRNIFLLYRLEHVGKPEIAASFGISCSAVDKHLMRAVAHLVRRARDVP